VEPRDLQTTCHHRSDGKDARRPHPAETRPARPRPSRDLRLRNRPPRAWLSSLSEETGAVPEALDRTTGNVASTDYRGWSLSGAPWLQPEAISGKSIGRE